MSFILTTTLIAAAFVLAVQIALPEPLTELRKWLRRSKN